VSAIALPCHHISRAVSHIEVQCLRQKSHIITGLHIHQNLRKETCMNWTCGENDNDQKSNRLN